MIASAKQTKQQYEERPFSFRNLLNSQFTIEEKLDISANPRITKKEGTSKFGKPYSMELAKLNISDGVFQKDLEMTEAEWMMLSRALPKGLINLQGVTLKIKRDNTGMGYDVEYIGVARQDMQGNAYNNAQVAPEQPAAQQQAKTINDYAEMLAQAVKQNTALGITTTYPILQKMADQIYPNRALDLIMAAKTKGCIADMGAEGYRGY